MPVPGDGDGVVLGLGDALGLGDIVGVGVLVGVGVCALTALSVKSVDRTNPKKARLNLSISHLLSTFTTLPNRLKKTDCKK